MSKENLTTEVEYQLDRWAQWAIKVLDAGIGYPKQSLEARLMDAKGILIRGTAGQPVLIDREAEEVDAIIKDLFLDEHTLKQGIALRLEYLARGSQAKKAAMMKVAVTRFKYYRDTAIYWLAGRLTAQSKFREKIYGSDH